MQSKKSRRSAEGSREDGGPARVMDEGTLPLARIVVTGAAPGSVSRAQEVLLQAFGESWPAGTRARFAMTMGGLLRSEFGTDWDGRTGSESGADDFAKLVEAATPVVSALLSPAVIGAARRCAEYLTLGIDLEWNDGVHAELIAVVDAAAGAVVHWTGKSFPMAAEAHRLIQVADLQSHYFEGAGERALLLCSHDLSIYSPRDRRTLSEGSPRWQRCRDMDALLSGHRPTVVLQHPFNTDSAQPWSDAWRSLVKQAPTISCWASGIAYHNRDEGDVPRRPLAEVLAGTRAPHHVADVIVPGQAARARAPERQTPKQPAS